jgi:DNA polymerase III epsilon subunit family exonuclease
VRADNRAMREIVFDTETTGLDPATGDRLVEIGCIEMVNRVPTGRTFHAYFNPDRSMPIEAERVHGLSEAFLADKKRFHEQVVELLEFISDSPLVAHNAQFDFGFLNWELSACGHPEVALERMIDTLGLARRRHPGAKHSLDALCVRYGSTGATASSTARCSTPNCSRKSTSSSPGVARSALRWPPSRARQRSRSPHFARVTANSARAPAFAECGRARAAQSFSGIV